MAVSVFGSLNLDIVLQLPSRMAWGQTLLVEGSEQSIGGKGLNQAIAAARFGSITRMAGAVGDDEAGALLRGALEAEGVDITHVAVLPGQTSGRATILIAPDGDNMIAVEAGANLSATAGHARSSVKDGARVLLAQLETDIDEIAALFADPAAEHAYRILNAAPAIPAGAKVFELCDMVVFNQTEFADYLELETEPQELDDLMVARKLLTRPQQVVVVTLGALGSAAIWADRSVFVPAIPASRVIDTTGAGDCFCGVLAACIDHGMDVEEGLQHANAAASLSVARPGAAPSMPARAEVDLLIAGLG